MGEPMESDEDGGSDLGEVEFQEDSPVDPEVVELLSSDEDKGSKAAKKPKNDVTTDVLEGENDITTEVVDLDGEDEKSGKAGSSKEKEKDKKKKKKRQKPDVPSDESYYASLPPKELKYLKKNLTSEEELSRSSIVCTACYKQVNYKQEGAMMRHADLAVPVCKRCRKFYHNGEWTKDEEGYYEYCSWCAQGGDLLCCDSCPNAFCKKCIKRNLGRSKVSEIEELDKWDCLVCEPVQVYKQRAQYYSIWTYSVKEAETEEQIKEKKEVRKNVKFVDEAHKDGMEVNKIFGNYLQKSMKSWATKCDEKVEKEDATKLVTKFRTIIKIAHHNLDLLDKQLLEGCMKSFPSVTEEELEAMGIPAESDAAEPESAKAKTNKSPKKKVKKEKPVKEEKNVKNGSTADTAASDNEVNGEVLAGAELELTSEEDDGNAEADADKKKGGLRVKSLSALLPKGMNKTSTPRKPGPASQTRKQGEKTPKKDVKGQKNAKECNGDASKDMFDSSEEEKPDPKVELVLPELDEANKAARAALLNSSSDENNDKEDTKSVKEKSKDKKSDNVKSKDKKPDDTKSKSKETDDTKSKDKNTDEDKSKDKKLDGTNSKNKKSDKEANEAARTALLNSSSDENGDKEDLPADTKSDDSKVPSSGKEKSKDKKLDDAKSKKKKLDDTKSKDENSDEDKSKDKKSNDTKSKKKKSDEDESKDKKSEEDEQEGDSKKPKEKKSLDTKPKDKKTVEEKSKDKKDVNEKTKSKKSSKANGNTSEDDVSKNKTSEQEKAAKSDSDDEFERMANKNSDDDSSKSKNSDDGEATKEKNSDKECSDVKDEEQSDVKEEVHPSLKPKKEKSDEEDGDKKDKTQKKKLKTKKELDEIKRRSVEKTAGDESGSQDESKSVKEEGDSSDKPEKKKKEKKSGKSNGTVFSNSSEDSGEDRLGIGEWSTEKKLTKKQEQQLKEKEEKKEKEKEIKKKEREEKSKAEKEEKEKKKKEKKSAKASDNDSDDDQLVKAVKKAKKMREKKLEKLRLKAAEIDPKIAQLSDMQAKIDVVSMNEEIKKDLKENEFVDLDTHPDLYTANDKDDNIDDEIDKLCDFGTLKGRTRDLDRDGDEKDQETKKKTNAKKKEKEPGMEDMSSGSEEGHSDEESDEEQKKTEEKSRQDLATKFLSRASVSSSSEGEEHSDDSTEGKVKDGKKSEKKKGEKKRKGHSSDSSDKEKKPKAKQSKLLSMKLSESESSDDDEKKYREKMEKKKAEQAKKKAEKGSGDSSDSDIMTNAAKKGSAKHKLTASGKKRKRALAGTDEEENGDKNSAEEEEEENSDSDADSDSDVDSDGAPKKKGKKKGKGKKKKKKASSSEEDSDVGERPKKKRKRIKKKGSDDSDDDDDDEEEDEEKSPTKRVDIKKVIKDKNLEEETKEAAVVEKERRKRIEERQERYNEVLGKAANVEKGAVAEEMILDFDEKTKETLVEVDKRLVKKLKPHQVGGIRFMWDTTFESLAQIKAGKMPGGAILAHCMGLGKTLQSVTLIHTVMSNPEIGVNRVMVLCPVNVVKNWAEEFDKWLIGNLEIDVFEMSGQKDNWGRADVLNSWFKEGGVLICGYDMFRNLTNPKNAKYKKKQKETFARCLLDPGADLIICDEGHLLKNEKSAINAAVNRIKSPRRIVLSGTPLQNNLKEYYEMVNFVKPQLMGTRKEFMNRFVNPIVNGQHSDSTERDVKMMKKRSYLLNDLLKGCMQRLDYNVLVPYLMPKQEYVLTIELTPFQKTLYKYYLANYAKAGQIGMDGKLEGGKKGGLFYDVQNLSRVWNHPYILLLSKMRKDMTNENDESGEEGSLKDFVCDDTEESESDTSSDDFSSSGSDSSDTAAAKKKKKKAKPASKRATRADKPEELVTLDDKEVVAKMSGTNAWWNQFLEEDQDLDDIMLGSKMVLLMDILKECAMMGDKVLVFSQSILSLDLIEDFLAKIHDNHEKSKKKDGVNNIDDSLETWVPGKDYYRMDGSTAADTRKVWCKYFNQASSHRMRLFLISTKAGGLGINLVAANRVIIFDASWNPSHDVQSIFRVFRFGQTKPVYIYRFLAKGTMEEKIYDRQVTKQSMSARVVDEHQIDSHFTMNDLVELYEFKDEPESARPIPMVPEDRLLAELVDKHKALVWNIHNHDSLLENKVDENLSEEERKRAWEEFENEKKGYIQHAAGNMQQQGVQHVQQMLQQQQQSINPMAIQAQLRQMYPQLSHEELMAKTRLVIMQYQQSIMEQSIMQQRQMQQQKLQQQQMQMQQQQQMQQQLAAARASAQRTIANRERTQGASKDVINLDDD